MSTCESGSIARQGRRGGGEGGADGRATYRLVGLDIELALLTRQRLDEDLIE